MGGVIVNCAKSNNRSIDKRPPEEHNGYKSYSQHININTGINPD